MIQVGKVAGFAFKDYERRLPRQIGKEGCCLAILIALDSEEYVSDVIAIHVDLNSVLRSTRGIIVKRSGCS